MKAVSAAAVKAISGEQALEGEHLRTLFNAMPDPAFLKDGGGRWLTVNGPALELFHLQGVAYSGKNDSELGEYSPFYREALLACVASDEDAWQKRVVSRGLELIPKPDGSVRAYDVIKVPVFHPDGSRKGLVVLGRDITEQKRAEDQSARLIDELKESHDALAKAQEELVQKERLAALGELAAVVAHEVRNPLGAIFNSIASLKRTLPLSGDAELLVGVLDEEAARLNRIVVELLNFVRPYHPAFETQKVQCLLKEAVATVERAQANATKVKVNFDLDRSLGALQLDPQLLHLALVNILSNAYQAMPDGGELTVSAKGVNGAAEISIADTGPGIPQELARKIFEPFFTTKALGTGLGLAIVKRIIDAHRGEISVSSQSPRGTTFLIRLPV